VKVPKLNPKSIGKTLFALVMFAGYWYWINQKLITDSTQAFGLTGLFLLICAATAYFPLPANLLVLGAVKDFDPLLVAFIAAVATLFAYLSEYFVFTLLFKLNRVAEFKNSWLYQKVAPLFERQQFLILTFASFLPIPSEPLRIYAITRKYSKALFMLSGFFGRFPRYFLLGYYGKDYVTSIWFIVAVVLFPAVFLLVVRGVYNIVTFVRLKAGYSRPAVEVAVAPSANETDTPSATL